MNDDETLEDRVNRIRDEDFLDEPVEKEEVEEDPYQDYVNTEVQALIQNQQ